MAAVENVPQEDRISYVTKINLGQLWVLDVSNFISKHSDILCKYKIFTLQKYNKSARLSLPTSLSSFRYMCRFISKLERIKVQN